jgi:hypothetical protein
MTVEQLISWIIPDAEECRREAERLRLRAPDAPVEDTARTVVQEARRWGTGLGAASGAIATPLTLVPAAVAESAALLRIEGKMAGTVAALLDPESLDDPDSFRRDILYIIFPGVFSQVLRRMGIRAGEQATKAFIQRYVTRGIVNEMLQHVAKLLGVRLTRKAIATKTVPLIGATIGAGWNWLELEAIGRRALVYHGVETGEESRFQRAVAKLRKRLPEKPQRPQRWLPGDGNGRS